MSNIINSETILQEKGAVRIVVPDHVRRTGGCVSSSMFIVGGFQWRIDLEQRDERHEVNLSRINLVVSLHCVGTPDVEGTFEKDWSCSISSLTCRAVDNGNHRSSPVYGRPFTQMCRDRWKSVTKGYLGYSYLHFWGHYNTMRVWENIAIEAQLKLDSITLLGVKLSQMMFERTLRTRFPKYTQDFAQGEITLESKDGKTCTVSGELLCAHSKVFQRMLENEFKEKLERRLVLPELSTAGFELFVKHINEEDISEQLREIKEEDQGLLLELLNLGEMYELKGLQWHAGICLWRLCSPDTVLQLYTVLRIYEGMPDVLDGIRSYIDQHIPSSVVFEALV